MFKSTCSWHSSCLPGTVLPWCLLRVGEARASVLGSGSEYVKGRPRQRVEREVCCFRKRREERTRTMAWGEEGRRVVSEDGEPEDAG